MGTELSRGGEVKREQRQSLIGLEHLAQTRRLIEGDGERNDDSSWPWLPISLSLSSLVGGAD